MRGLVPGLATPHPIGAQLPGVLQDDPVAMLLTEGLDEVLAPVIGTLDNLWGYLDPALAPADFLEWLAGWVGAELDENWSSPRQRRFVAEAVELYRVRGTVAGLRRHVELVTGAAVEVADTGGVTWSVAPDGDDRPPVAAEVTVRVRAAGPEHPVDVAAVSAVVASAKPAHIHHSVEIA